jgi:hypothetical protein
MSDAKSNVYEEELLKLVFNATAIANIADDAGSSPLEELFVSLHTSAPGETGNQTTNETNYGAYARIGVARTTAGWTVTDNSVSPAADIEFPQCTSGSGTISHFAVGTASSGTGKVLYYGTVTPNIAVTTGVQPRLTTATAITEN